MRKMMKRMAAVTMGMAIAMTATACSSNSGSAAPASTQKEGTDAAVSYRITCNNGNQRTLINS